MNPKVMVGVVGSFTVLLGLGGLFYPQQVMQLVGFGLQNPPNPPGSYGEVRALYGGLTLVAGVLTLLAVPNPHANQGRLMLLGLLFLGACAGRMLGVFVDGNPGLLGWMSAVVELLGGGALLVASQSGPEMPESSSASGAAPLIT